MEGWNIRFPVVHPSPHVGVHRHTDVSDLNLSRFGWRGIDFANVEVLSLGQAVWASLQCNGTYTHRGSPVSRSLRSLLVRDIDFLVRDELQQGCLTSLRRLDAAFER